MVRRLGVVDLTLITIGAVIGSGIFRTPAIVTARAHSTTLVMTCWLLGGLISLIGACIFAELAARRPLGGGLYAYLRDAFGPLVGFLVPWMVMLLAYVGSTALSAVLFADYLVPLTGLHLDTRLVAVVTLAIVTAINMLGVRQGSTWQNFLVALKVLGIGVVIVAGFLTHARTGHATPLPAFGSPAATLAALGAAMIPVLFSYNNFQSTAYMTAETVAPSVTIPRGLMAGVVAIIVIYLLANVAYLHVLGIATLATSTTPAADVMRAAFGERGAAVVAFAIAASTLGFISNAVLLAPRLYFQVANDGLFFKQVAWISPKTHVPMVAIALHGTIAAIYASTGTYEQILNWITAWIWIFSMLAAIALFVYRRRDAALPRPGFMTPLHPWSTLLFIAAILGIFAASCVQYPRDTAIGAAVMIAGIAFYFVWTRVHGKTAS